MYCRAIATALHKRNCIINLIISKKYPQALTLTTTNYINFVQILFCALEAILRRTICILSAFSVGDQGKFPETPVFT